MTNDKYPTPRNYKGVSISSTFTDLKDHRAALIKAIKGQGLTDVAMENDSAKPNLDVIDSSLQMVRDGSAYIGVIGRRYGQTPECPERNPAKSSITELEFNEAQRLNRPILLFIMGEKHPVIEADIESNATKKKKLKTFRERAKKMGPDSSVHRVYANFNSLEEFKEKVIHAVADLRRYLDDQAESPTQRPKRRSRAKRDLIPKPPAFYAEPPYIGSHKFLGRKAQLDTLSDWAAPADPHPILLFEAIGGAGKSMLTWEWTTKHATIVRKDWAGRFWYSFYEKGAIMADFCRRALAYITGQPLEDFQKKKTPELSEILLHQLQARPWLLILDGLERVLVAYHRFDAAQLVDEEAGKTDEIAHRDPCSAIRPEDDDLLRALAAPAPSKILVTSRLTPRALLNQSSQPIPGVLRKPLPGLRPADAEALLRSCGVTGTSQDIQDYLQSHCDCHPLVTGVLTGLIKDYLPDRGNFDAWVDDPAGGGQLNLANLDLIQKRNHILYAALAALPEKNRQLLSTLALLSESVDYKTLGAFNPHLPPAPEEVKLPDKPEDIPRWKYLSDEEKEREQRSYESAVQRYEEYEEALIRRRRSPEFRAAPPALTETVRDLERRGMLQYDAQTKRYDLHPVVRGISAGGLRQEEKEIYGQRVVDHFSRQAHNPYEEAETLEDLRDGLHVVRTLLQMGRHQEAFDAYSGALSQALEYNLEAYAEILTILRSFYSQGWATLPSGMDEGDFYGVAWSAASALYSTGEYDEALAAYVVTLRFSLRDSAWANVRIMVSNISGVLKSQNRLAKEERCLLLGLDLANLIDEKEHLFRTRLWLFEQLATIGQWTAAEAMWQLLDPMGRTWPRWTYRPGEAEADYARLRFWLGDLKEKHLTQAEQLAKAGRNRFTIRDLHRLRGEWQVEQGQWAVAADSFHEAVRLAREGGHTDTWAEAQLALAKFHLNQLPDARYEAEQLAKARHPAHRVIADLWFAIGDAEQAQKHAIAAYKWAWADGEPYVHRYELNKARALLEQLGAEIPNLAPYDPAKDEKLPWEDEVADAIEKLRAEKEAEEREEEKTRKKEMRRTAKKKTPKDSHRKKRSNKS
jgi:tetratricopeptide (TPR) repeat protein